jgi:Putative peptidoglycan binding domain/Glycosyl hydrolase family 26
MPAVKKFHAFQIVLVLLASTLGIAVVFAIPAPTIKLSAYPTLHEGATGTFVKVLQARLDAWNVRPQLSVEGDFDRPTLEAVEAFQLAKKLPYDGIVDRETWRALLADPSAGHPADKLPAITISAEIAAEMHTLLNEGNYAPATPGYFEPTSSLLVAAAGGALNSSFYDLGVLLVQDGLSNTIIDLGREMNGAWYEWSEHRAPPSEPDAFILAWRQIVTTMRSVPGQHFKFLWTIYMSYSSVAESWPGSAYVDYIGSDIFDWYGGINNAYPTTTSGVLDHQWKWQQILTWEPGGLNWMADFSLATGKPIIIPEWGLDFHADGGQDDPLFITNMMAWMKAHNAIGLYWDQQHVSSTPTASGPLLANLGASGQVNTPGWVNAMGALMGGRLQYAGVYLPDREWLSDSVAQPLLAPWEGTGYTLVLSAPMVPNPPEIPSYSGPPELGDQPYQLADYPDAVAALAQGAALDRRG